MNMIKSNFAEAGAILTLKPISKRYIRAIGIREAGSRKRHNFTANCD